MFKALKLAAIGYLIACLVAVTVAVYLLRDLPWWVTTIGIFLLIASIVYVGFKLAMRKLVGQFAQGLDWVREQSPAVESELLNVERSTLPAECGDIELSDAELADATIIKARIKVLSASGWQKASSWHPEGFNLGTGAGPAVGQSIEQLRSLLHQQGSVTNEMERIADDLQSSIGGWSAEPIYFRAYSETGELVLDNGETADERYPEEALESGLSQPGLVELFFVLLGEEVREIRDIVWVTYGHSRKHHFMLADV